jgi:hypothetical protein
MKRGVSRHILLLCFVSIVFIDLGWSKEEQKSCKPLKSKYKKTKTQDISEEFGPVRDQDSLGWCYAFAAADLLSHYIRKEGGEILKSKDDRKMDVTAPENRVSPTAMSIQYNKKYKDRDLYTKKTKGQDYHEYEDEEFLGEGGKMHWALKHSMRKFCTEAEMPSGDFEYVPTSGCTEKESGDCQLYGLLATVFQHDEGKEGDEAWCSAVKAAQEIYGDMPIDDIWKVFKGSHRTKVLNRLRKKRCKHKVRKRFRPKIVEDHVNQGKKGKDGLYTLSPKNDKLFNMIDKQLDKQLPIGISFYSGFLKGKNEHEGSHAVVVVGKKYNPKTCEVEYKLRNSWGATGCGSIKTEDEIEDNSGMRVSCETEVQGDISMEMFSPFSDGELEKLRKLGKKWSKLERKKRNSKIATYCSKKYPDEVTKEAMVEACSNGYITVTRSQLAPHLFGATYLEKKK